MSRHRLTGYPHQTMASLETGLAIRGISPRFDKLLKDVVDDLGPEELTHAVSSIKKNFEGNFATKGEQDLYSCLHLFANQGLVTEDNLTLLERFVVTPKTLKKEGIQAKIHSFKEIRLREATPATRRELTGRHSDLQNVMSKLTSGGSSVLNLYGSSGVGKTTLANEAWSKWQGRKFKADLREVNEMKDVYFHVLQALSIGSEQTKVSFEANPVIAEIQQLRQLSQGDILLLLDNVDQFSGGNIEAALRLNENFVSFLGRLIGPKTDREKTRFKILLTSRSEFRHGVENHEVQALEKASSGELLQSQGIASIPSNQRGRLVEMCKGKPLLLNGMAAILRQEIADAEKLLGTIEQELEAEPEQDTEVPLKGQDIQKKETFDIEEEGIDEEQLSCLRKMFFFLPSQTLRESAVAVSFFCRPFSVEAAAKILDVDTSEAAIRMEGMRNSKVVSIVPEAKELLYDIHPLMRKFLKSVGSNKTFEKVQRKASGNFSRHFISKMTAISALLDKEYVKAFTSFDFDKPNFELALDISLKSDFLLIPQEHCESIMICYLFEAMLDLNQRRKIFNSWAEKVEDDGKEGSMFRAEMRCREALQVLNLEGWRKAAEVAKEARESLERVHNESKKTDFFKLTRSSYLFVEGEVCYRAGNWPKALKILNRSLKIMEGLLKSHTSTCRCLNAIGNCHSKLGEPEKAIEFYTKAYEMRRELSGSMEHFDLPLFQSQIGTAYESMAMIQFKKANKRMTPEAEKNFRKAIKDYQKALELAKKLKLTGILYTALYNRNIANAYSWLMEFDDAKVFATRGFEIRKDILGKHPLTARSAFQMAEICRSLEDFEEAEEYYEEAWEIEKCLGQGNHSEVRDRIVTSYEGILRGQKKNAFQKEVLEFYRRCWDEERGFEGFEFSSANRTIIDSIEDRIRNVGDVKTRKKYQSEALWFYEGAWNSPDTKKLPYEERENILQTLLRLCKQLKKEELFRKYQEDSFRFYEKRCKKNWSELERRDRIDILRTLESLATSLNYVDKAKKYQDLKSKQESFWQSLNPFTSAGKLFPHDDDDDDDDDDDGYDVDIDDDDDDDDDDGNGDGDDNDNDDEVGNDGSGEIAEEQELPQQLHELQLEGQEEQEQQQQQQQQQQEQDEPDADKTTIHEGMLTSEGTHWNLKLGSVHLMFPPNSVSESTEIVVHKWKCSACSPPLQEHEAIVSNVIEISTANGQALEFNAEVKLFLSHSAPDLKGYELVIKRQIDQESNDWEEVDGTEDLRSLQDVEDNGSILEDIPDFFFPVAQADITECSTYAVVCRLKSSPCYSITSKGGSFSHPDYPDVCVTIPKKAVAPKAKFPMELKVQEVPSEEFEGQDVLLGPALRIACSQVVQFLTPVTIQLPVSLQDEREGIPDPSTCRVRVFFLRPDGEDKEWIEITNDLVSPASFDGTLVKFQVERFSGYAVLLDWCKKDFSVSGIIGYLTSLIWNQPLLAVFFAYFLPPNRPYSQDILYLICCPAHLREQVIQELERRNVIPSEGNSKKKMIPGNDKAFVFVSGGISPVNMDDMEDFHLKFEGNFQFKDQLQVRLISDQVLSHVEFRSTPDQQGKNLLSKLNFRLSSLTVKQTRTPVEFFGVPLNDKILLEAPADLVLGECKRFVTDEVYEQHFTHLTSGNQGRTKVLQNFFGVLAGLDGEKQDECFDAIVKTLSRNSSEGFEHVIERLQQARQTVSMPLATNNEVMRIVSEKVVSLWKRLARGLELGEGRIDSISEEENDDQDCCYKALQTWLQLKGEGATIRTLMIKLTKTGLAEVNNDIMRCLKTFRPSAVSCP